jgi:hypothetical protein
MTGAEATPEQRLLIDLCLRFLTRFFWQGPGLLLIDRGGIVPVLQELEHRDVAVLGLEGFELDGADVLPRLDLVFDSERVPGFPTPQEAIETWPDSVWIDVTIGPKK